MSGNKEGDPGIICSDRIYAVQIQVINYKLVVFLHGGPGSGTDPEDRQFFNPAKYNVSKQSRGNPLRRIINLNVIDCSV